jgi:hypothetical protein
MRSKPRTRRPPGPDPAAEVLRRALRLTEDRRLRHWLGRLLAGDPAPKPRRVKG